MNHPKQYSWVVAIVGVPDDLPGGRLQDAGRSLLRQDEKSLEERSRCLLT